MQKSYKLSILLKKKIDDKRNFRKIRSRLKSKLRRRANLPTLIKKKYNLLNYKHSHPKLMRAKERIEIIVPEVFCLMHDHEKAIKFLNEVEEQLKENPKSNLFVNHYNTKTIGLAASYLFDSKIKNYIEESRNIGYRISLIGKFSEDKDVNNFLVSFGLLNELDIKENYDRSRVDEDYGSKLLTYKISGSAIKPLKKGTASLGLSDYFNRCFNHNGFYIHAEALERISYAVSEIIGNAEEHAEENNKDWKVLGFYNKVNSTCSFAIVNYGCTVYESLSGRSSTSRDVLASIEKVINSHKSLLQKSKDLVKGVTEECIWNVMALQDGISSKKPESGKGSSRGQGLLEVLSFIDEIRDEGDTTEIDFISGSSKIRIDYEYPIVREEIEGKLVRKIMFNKERDLFKLQDESKVIKMSDSFRGTIITGKFIINSKYLSEKLNKSKK